MKKFKVAHITTLAHIEDVFENQYQMCLAHLALENEQYREAYATMRKHGSFVLMDNGVAEQCQLPVDKLLKAYELVNPNEIVLPDTLCNTVDTLRKTLAFVKEYSELPYRFMGVPQGTTLDEWLLCARIMLMEPRINTIGISKFLNIKTGNPCIRLEAVNEIDSMVREMGRYDVEVHLLGCDEGPAVVRHIADKFPIVRGCDTAFAFLATQADKKIVEDMERPKGSIFFLDRERHYDDYLENSMEFENVVGCSYNGLDHSWM